MEKRMMLKKVLIYHIALTGLALLTLLLPGCATIPSVSEAPTVITINTIPASADISVQGNYIGQSPLAIPITQIPSVRAVIVQRGAGTDFKYELRSDHPIQIEAQLTGYNTKSVSFGDFNAPSDQVVQPLFSYSAVTKTIPGYYIIQNQITIKLSPSPSAK